MVCGADLLDSFKIIKPDGQPLWSPEHREIILERNGIACLKREGTDLEAVGFVGQKRKDSVDGYGQSPFRALQVQESDLFVSGP